MTTIIIAAAKSARMERFDEDIQLKKHVSGSEIGYLPRIGLWEYDVISKSNTWSPAVFDILELSYNTMPSHTFAFTFYPDPHQNLLKKAIAKAYQFGKPWDLELELITAKGKRIWVRTYGDAIIENEVVLKIKGVLMDIDKYRSTETSINLLKQRYKQLSSFTHILTHDLRNHTGNISLLASLVDKKLLDENNADLFDKLNHVAENLSLTIDHLSEIVKVNENVMETEILNFNHHLLSAISLLNADLNMNEAHIQTDFLVPSVLFPKLYLDSILTNLLSNSIKYKKDSISPEIFICTYKDEDQNCIVLEYQDNGIGIDLSKHADKVFGLYNTFTDRPGAHGVGLFLVKNQIESQGGYVLIESTPNVGTIFRIFFKPNS